MSERPPLVLLHGVTNTARVWDGVVPHLDGFDLLVPTAAGHRGGPPKRGTVTISSLVDDVEVMLDDAGLDQAHIAGNSMGGWMAIELARRGRALSVCAFSPAGCWTPGDSDMRRATSTIGRGRARAKALEGLAPHALKVGFLRRRLLRDAAAHADRLTPEQAMEMVRDLIECDAAEDLLATTEHLHPLHPLPCPVTVAWPGKDRIAPLSVNGETCRARIPAADFFMLEDVGHVPMLDDPELCAQVIRQATGV
jgi:pimeloyl-ACP methyl ester carboxylesterase